MTLNVDHFEEMSVLETHFVKYKMKWESRWTIGIDYSHLLLMGGHTPISPQIVGIVESCAIRALKNKWYKLDFDSLW